MLLLKRLYIDIEFRATCSSRREEDHRLIHDDLADMFAPCDVARKVSIEVNGCDGSAPRSRITKRSVMSDSAQTKQRNPMVFPCCEYWSRVDENEMLEEASVHSTDPRGIHEKPIGLKKRWV
jgi:hypothetical protein